MTYIINRWGAPACTCTGVDRVHVTESGAAILFGDDGNVLAAFGDGEWECIVRKDQ